MRCKNFVEPTSTIACVDGMSRANYRIVEQVFQMQSFLRTTALLVGLSLLAAAAPEQSSLAKHSLPYEHSDPSVPKTMNFSDASNSGVPAGTLLSPYEGPLIIAKADTTIDSKIVRGKLVIAANSVTLIRSKLVGNIDSDRPGADVTIIDSEVDGGRSSEPAIGYANIILRRVNVHGSRVSVLSGSNCLIEDSWLHGQYLAPGSDWHVAR